MLSQEDLKELSGATIRSTTEARRLLVYKKGSKNNNNNKVGGS